jgi:glutamine amidotransferase
MSLPEVIIIDYGAGNLLSVQRAFEHCGAKVNLTADPEMILRAERVVLPGVGAYTNAMNELKKNHLVDVILKAANKKIPLLGICLGMQLLFDESDEFVTTKGLGLISGRVTAIPQLTLLGEQLKIPHIGWSEIISSNYEEDWKQSLLTKNKSGDEVYFTHSYMVKPNNTEDIIANTYYGGVEIPAVIRKGNISGCQFHPEKSGQTGLKILEQFLLL